MGLQKELKTNSIVILAQSFNPSIFNRYWLVSNEFIDDKIILPNSVFAPNVTQVATKEFSLLVLPEQLQFNSLADNKDFKSDIEKTLKPIVSRLKEIPYKACGINFHWFVDDEAIGIGELSKKFFYYNNSRLHQEFQSEDSRYGVYMSKNFENARVKLDVKPTSVTENSTGVKNEFIQFSFNFHIDLAQGSASQELINFINNWSKFKTEAEKLTSLVS